MESAALAQFRDRLEVERKELARQLEDIGVSPETGAPKDVDFEHGFADSGQTTAEKARLLSVAEHLLDTLREVESALRRLDEGRFGLCERCGREIPVERLEALPHARLCVACKRRG